MSAIVDTFIAYQFIKILSTPWIETDAYKLGIIDDKGNVLIPHNQLKSNRQKKAYTIFHRLVWNIKRLLDKLPTGKTRLTSFATALWLLKEHNKKLHENYDIEPLIILFEEYLDSNNIQLTENTQLSFKEYLSISNKKINKGLYKINKDMDFIDESVQKNDIFICESLSKSYDDIFNKNLYPLKHKKSGKILFVSEEDLNEV